MKRSIVLLAVLLLPLLFVPVAVTFQQMVEAPSVHSVLSHYGGDTVACDSLVHPCGPGSGGGGGGVI